MHVRRVQRNTLTYAQMEGSGIWDSIKKFVKKHHIISKALGAAGVIAKFVPLPGASVAGSALGFAGTAAGLAGYGMSGKGISSTQMKAIKMGLARFQPSGGISLMAAKYMYPKIKNISPNQVRSLASGFARMVKSGGLSLKGGKHSGMYHKGCMKAMKPMYRKPMAGSGYSGRGYGAGVNLAGGYSGSGVRLAGQGRRVTQKKKNKRRIPVRSVYRY